MTKQPPRKKNPTKERGDAYKKMVSEDYKDLYQADVDRIVQKRVKSSNEKLSAYAPIMDALAARYGTQSGDLTALQEAMDNDNSIWERRAEDAGMSVEQFREVTALRGKAAEFQRYQQEALQQEQQKAQISTWVQQADTLKAQYPELDLATELEAGFGVEDAYKVCHMDELLTKAAHSAQSATIANIQARGARPKEGAIHAQNGVTTKADPKTWSTADFEEVRRRAQRGEQIIL